MSEEIIKVLDNLAQKFGIAIDWTNQNIVPYLQELIRRFIAYKNCIAIVWILIAILIIILAIIGVKMLNKWKKSKNYDDDRYSDDPFVYWFCIIGLIIIAGIGVSLILGNILGIAKNIYMPELVAIEYVKTLGE